MNRILILALVTFLVGACGGPPLPTPDVVATEAAQALAVAGTLIYGTCTTCPAH